MLSYFSDLRYREVIDIHTGFRLGYICDAEFDDESGRLCSTAFAMQSASMRILQSCPSTPS